MRVLLCDDHRLFVEPLSAVLVARGHETRVVTTLAGAVRALDDFEPELCVMDLRLPDGSGLDGVAALHRRRPACPVVVLSGSVDRRDAAAAVTAGAAGFLSKAQPMSAVLDALDRLGAGEQLAPASWAFQDAEPDEHRRVRELVAGLTGREREVLHRLVEAADTLEIARALGVAPSTARTHLQNVLLKLGVHSRLQAVSLVVQAGMGREP
ncbi:response regulator transcription factor [Blastococcus brunescens]|uniref:Response regulator transcription factor n=1 Tax=Blastococcus brunescens TaxID=1564165 RepID=A0ABZ1B5N1_9ACTN|nr:response regulator transcription factor [Blastococcus sp. BMG 8361]WRL64330.1 response regulator transcription factor [Blastococcus sp. BMG 8361]